MESVETKIADVFKVMGVHTDPLKGMAFERKLLEFGEQGKKFLTMFKDRAKNGISGTLDVYRLKNSSYKFSNLIFDQFDSDRICRLIFWFAGYSELDMENKTLIDIGCDTGVFICSLAKIFPEAKFVGVDPCQEALSIARERAQRLGLSNVEFRKGSWQDVTQSGATDKFDYVFSSMIWQEIFKDLDGQAQASLVQSVGNILRSGGSYIVMERLPDEGIAWFSQVLEGAGLRIDNQHSCWICYQSSAVAMGKKKSRVTTKPNREPVLIFQHAPLQPVNVK